MKTKIEEIDGKFIVTLEGEMDTAAAEEAEKELKALYKSEGKDVIIECGGLEYIARRHYGRFQTYRVYNPFRL